ncbi:valine--tRNA ligase [Candidatus Saccharibacteria bacterium]|nr:valine--tRNA ligase [Candidatus Saccharibacteria bacterium]
MKFASSYEPSQFEPDIYAAWETSGAFKPTTPTVPIDNNDDGIDDRFETDVILADSSAFATTGASDEASPVTTGASEEARESASITSRDTYSIVMPPPNANGNLHIGHGLTVALEDSLTRFYRLNGKSSWYIPGADHAGFETWVVYERTLEKDGHTRFEFDRDTLYARVWDFVAMQRGNMELQLRALGASCSWGDLTFTLDENVIDRVYTTFEKMWNDGLIYRGEKLVNFCPKHQTAFADIEVEHKDEKGTLWEIEYPLMKNDDADILRAFATTEANNEASPVTTGVSEEASEMPVSSCIIVSTTRPETLFGDMAIAVNPADDRYKPLIGKHVHLPLTDRTIPIIADEHADPEYGTGAVKITPAHDFDDFEVGTRHDLDRLQVISEDGHMINVPDKYISLTPTECRKQVLKDLESAGLLRGEQKITHSVAHCYKCGTVLEPTLKEQWFVDVKRLASDAIRHLEQGEITFYPENKQRVLINYLENLKDWNISRQIPWGIAIPMFRKVTEEATDEPEWIFDRRTNLKTIEKSGVTYVRDEDTFDTWFSSSHWPIVCTDWSEDNPTPYYPLNVMETGADILFAWVARMIMMGLYVTGEVPFKEVYLHGLVLDAHGQKMSKSKGNVINPMDMVARYGSDAFRLGILRGRSAGMNQAFSENSVVSGRNLCNKLWNISRLIQSVVDEDEETEPRGAFATTGANDEASPVTTGASEEATRGSVSSSYTTNNQGEDWICREINQCLADVASGMHSYRFSEAVETLYQTIWDKYADWFLESQKIYRNVPLLKTTLEHLLIALHPFAPFVTEAIWQNLSWTSGMIINAKWPGELIYDPISATEFESLISVVSEVRTTLQALPGTNNAKKYALLFDNDSLVEDNLLLIKALTKVPAVTALNGAPRGLRLALANHELYLDVPEKVVKDYKDALTDKILAVGRELDGLNARMLNPNYVDKAPAHLVKETQDAIKEKSDLISRLKTQLELI